MLKLPVYLIFSYQAVIYLHCKLGHPQSERTPTCPAQPAGDSACCCRTQHDHKHACGSKKVRCQCCLSVQYSGSARREAVTAPSAEGAIVRQYESHRHHNPGHDPAGPSRGALPTAQKHPNCVYFLVGFCWHRRFGEHRGCHSPASPSNQRSLLPCRCHRNGNCRLAPP